MSVKITGTTVQGDSSTIPDHRTDWELFIDVIDWRGDRKRLETYLSVTLGLELKDPGCPPHEIFTDRNYAMAVTGDYFAEKHFCRFEKRDISYGQPPQREPDKATEAYRLWAVQGVTREVHSPRHAGFDLYCECGSGKLEMAEAKRIVRDKYPELAFRWDEVLKAFRKNGGRHTDKYLRRES